MNSNHLLTEALEQATQNLRDSRKVITQTRAVKIPHFNLAASINISDIDEHTYRIISMIEELSGQYMDEEALLAFERKTFLSLIRCQETLQKIQSALK